MHTWHDRDKQWTWHTQQRWMITSNMAAAINTTMNIYDMICDIFTCDTTHSCLTWIRQEMDAAYTAALNEHVKYRSGDLNYNRSLEEYHAQIFHQVIYQWVVSSVTNESCHTWISHVTYESCLRSFIRLSINESCRRLWTSHVTLISHVTYESCLRSFITLSINELCRVWTSHVIHESVMSHMSYVTDLPSGYIRMSHVTHEWVTSHINESYHVCMSHLTYEWVMSHTNELCHVWMSHVIYEWVISHIICQVVRKWIEEYCSQTNESCYIWMSHITYNKWYASEWVMSLHNANESRSTVHRQMSHVTYEWVMSHTIKHTQVNESCHCTSHRYTYLDGRSDSFICSMTHS